jgi:beta-galactosidase beta subunit
MPEGFRRLESRVQRSENGTVQSKLTIQVWQDSEKVTETALEVNQDYVDIKAILKPEKKIRLVVTSSDPMNLGTEIQWKQPRLLR